MGNRAHVVAAPRTPCKGVTEVGMRVFHGRMSGKDNPTSDYNKKQDKNFKEGEDLCERESASGYEDRQLVICGTRGRRGSEKPCRNSELPKETWLTFISHTPNRGVRPCTIVTKTITPSAIPRTTHRSASCPAETRMLDQERVMLVMG